MNATTTANRNTKSMTYITSHTKRSNRGLLYRRMRAIALLVIIMVIAGIGISEAYEPTKTIQLSVGNGDTLWQIASEVNSEYYQDKKDPRELVYEISSYNNLSSAMIYPGQELTIPLE